MKERYVVLSDVDNRGVMIRRVAMSKSFRAWEILVIMSINISIATGKESKSDSRNSNKQNRSSLNRENGIVAEKYKRFF